jgi:hypothetical protein
MTTLELLRQIVPPPANPVATGSPDRWEQVEAELGTRLPDDYKQLIHTYGFGEFSGFFVVYDPFVAGERGNLLFERHDTLQVYNDMRETALEPMEHPPYPEPGGVLPMGQTTNGDHLFWITRGEPDEWPVLLSETGFAEEVHRCTATEFIVLALTGQLASHLLPGDITTLPREFHPIDAASPS